MQENGSITGFPGAQAYEGENLLFEEVDILIPAAIEHAIDMSNVDKIKAKVCSGFPPKWLVDLLRVATAQGKQGKQGIWFLLFPDRENTGNFALTQGKILRHRENIFL